MARIGDSSRVILGSFIWGLICLLWCRVDSRLHSACVYPRRVKTETVACVKKCKLRGLIVGDCFNAVPEGGLAIAAVLLLMGAAEGGVIIARRHKPGPEGADRFLFTLAAPTIGLLALMIGFTFLMVLTHYQTRVAEVMEAANTIERAALRARMLPEPYRSAVTPLLKEYATLRVAHRGAEIASSAMMETNRRAIEIQEKLWDEARPQQCQIHRSYRPDCS